MDFFVLGLSLIRMVFFGITSSFSTRSNFLNSVEKRGSFLRLISESFWIFVISALSV